MSDYDIVVLGGGVCGTLCVALFGKGLGALL